MQAITVSYLPPTNHRGARVKATCAAGSIVIGWNYDLSDDDNYDAAAKAITNKLGWHRDTHGAMVRGTLADGRFVYVLTGKPAADAVAGCPSEVPR